MARGEEALPGITLITPTGGRPEAFALCELWMKAQTYRGPLQWIVVDDCEPKTITTMGQELVNPLPLWQPGQNTQFRNMLAALPLVRYDKILHWEDDDHYSPEYIDTIARHLDEAELVGEIPTRYYNVRFRAWHPFGNDQHASLCQTGMRSSVIPTLQAICERKKWIDMALWPAVADKKMFHGSMNVGIKGMPGRPGQVRQHRNSNRMVADPNLEMLRSWIGDDAEAYAKFGEAAA